jgi:hypothetical protein
MLVIVALLATVVAGCSKGSAAGATPSPGGPTSPGAGESPSPSPTPDLIEFTVDGAGPYQLDATLLSLRAQLDQVAPAPSPCSSNTAARGTGVWKDILLSFHPDGSLYLLTNRSAAIPTPSGAYLGTTVADLKKIYVGLTGQDLTRGADTAFLVGTLSGRGILFELDPGKRVIAMRAGETSYLKAAYNAGGTFC